MSKPRRTYTARNRYKFQNLWNHGAATSVSIRGASSLQTLVLVDGRRVNDISLGSAFHIISVDNIERIEIIRGEVQLSMVQALCGV